MSHDGDVDTIMDFEVGIDKLDLSGWDISSTNGQLQVLFLSGQLEYEATTTGAILRYGDETLVVNSADGNSLTIVDIFGPSLGFAAILGTVWADEIFGTIDGDAINGRGGDDTLIGGAGDDIIYGGGGGDLIYGGDGNDIIDGGPLFDTIYAGAGNDTVWGGDGVDTVYLGPGDDIFYDNDQTGGYGIDWVAGGPGDDRIYGGGGNDALLGGPGNDRIWGGVGDDKLWGHDGNDLIYGEDGNDTVYGGNGRDVAWLGAGDDTYYESSETGPNAADEVHGGDGNDRILAGAGPDTIWGDGGDDEIYGGDDADWIDGGAGSDVIHAGSGNDTVYGGTGPDLIYLNQGDDVFYDDAETGPGGADRIYGHLGNDTFHGGGGDDRLWGGPGADTFVFYTGNGDDTIADFEDGVDIIDLSATGLGYGDLTITQVGADTVIGYGADTITLTGIDAGQISEADFLFGLNPIILQNIPSIKGSLNFGPDEIAPNDSDRLENVKGWEFRASHSALTEIDRNSGANFIDDHGESEFFVALKSKLRSIIGEMNDDSDNNDHLLIDYLKSEASGVASEINGGELYEVVKNIVESAVGGDHEHDSFELLFSDNTSARDNNVVLDLIMQIGWGSTEYLPRNEIEFGFDSGLSNAPSFLKDFGHLEKVSGFVEFEKSPATVVIDGDEQPEFTFWHMDSHEI